MIRSTRIANAAALLPLFVPLAVAPGLADPWRLPQQAAFVLLAGVAALAALALDPAPLPRLPRLAVAGIATTAAALVLAAVRAPDPAAARIALGMDGAAIAVAVVLARRVEAGLEPSRIAAVLIAMALVQSLVGPIQLATVLPSSDPEGKLALTGTLGNPEYVASLAGVALLLVPALPPRRGRLGIAVVLAATLLLTRSRGAILAAAAAAAFVWLPRRRAAALAALAAAAVLVAALGGRSGSGRLLVWAIAVREAVASRGLGVGLGGFGAAMIDAQRWVLEHGGARFAASASMVTRAHDEPLDALAEGGIALVAAGALLFAAPLAAARRRRDAWSAALVFVALDSLVSFPLHEPALLAATAALAAVLLARPGGDGVRAPRHGFAVAALGAVIALAGLDFANAAIASRLEARAGDSLRRGRFLEADERVRRALAFRPGDPDLLLMRGRLLYRAFRSREALAYARERDALAGPSVDGLKLEGMAELDLGEIDAALTTYRALEAAFPRQVTAHVQIGRILLARGDREGAARELELALACPAKNHKAVVDRLRAADDLRSLGRGEGADLLQ